MSVRVVEAEARVLSVRLRMPFRYGIACVTDLPHVWVRVRAVAGGGSCVGYSAENLAPKWFTKNPDTSYAEDAREMAAVVSSALRLAVEVGEQPDAFTWWREVASAQAAWASARGLPPLLWNLGVSLVERAMLDAVCRAIGRPFADALRFGALGFDPTALHADLAGQRAADLLPSTPLSRVRCRHTVGLGDPLAADDPLLEPAPRDGLPVTLTECVERYGIDRLKVKLSGDPSADVERVARIAEVLGERALDAMALTLDGNENYASVDGLERFWRLLIEDRRAAAVRPRILWIEQPLHRDAALTEETGRALRAWSDRPPIIVDESDGAVGDLSRAVQRGYAGTSHKGCKGIFKGAANACWVAARNRSGDEPTFILSGEDLTTVGPIGLPQDLCAMAALGIEHVERNGHHYVDGLGFLPHAVADCAAAAYARLYEPRAGGSPPRLRVREGWMDVGDVLEAPFGVRVEPPWDIGVPLPDWQPEEGA